MDPAAHTRRLRQLIDIDRLLGLDAVPMSDRAIETPDDPAPAPPPERSGMAMPEPSAPKWSIRRDPPSPIPALSPMALHVDTQTPLPPNTMTRPQKIDALAALEQELADFVDKNWPRDGWQRLVFGEGDPEAKLMFIGEGPGADEDKLGRPFVGRAGQLLDKQIAAMTLQREEVYIANIAKTRPPENRVPTPDEAARWMPFLVRQIEIIQPKVIVTLGGTSAKYLLNDPKLAITRQRGQWRLFRGIDLMPTFHPAYLLRQYTHENRERVWLDLQAVMQKLGLQK